MTSGSPASVAGILPNDVLVSVDNQDLKNLPLAEAKLILAELGPQVRSGKRLLFRYLPLYVQISSSYNRIKAVIIII